MNVTSLRAELKVGISKVEGFEFGLGFAVRVGGFHRQILASVSLD